MLRLGNFSRFVFLYVLATFNPVILFIMQWHAGTLGLVERTSPTAHKLLLSLLSVYAFISFLLIGVIAAVRYGVLRLSWPQIEYGKFLDAFLFSQLAYLPFSSFLYYWLEGQESFAQGVFFFIAYIPLSLICIPLSLFMFRKALRVLRQKQYAIGTEARLSRDLTIFVVLSLLFAAGSLWQELPYTKYSQYFSPRPGSPQEALGRITTALKTGDAALLANYADLGTLLELSADDPLLQTVVRDIQAGRFSVSNAGNTYRITYREYVIHLDAAAVQRRNAEIYCPVNLYLLPRHKPFYAEVQLKKTGDHFAVAAAAGLRQAILRYQEHIAALARQFPDFEAIAPQAKAYLDCKVLSWFTEDNAFRKTQELRARVWLTNKTNRDISAVRFLGLIKEAADDNAIWDFSLYGRLEPPLAPGRSREVVCTEASRDYQEFPPNLGREAYRLVPYEIHFADRSIEDLRVKR